MKTIFAMIMMFFLLFWGQALAESNQKQEYEVVGQFGRIVTVYMSPGGLDDKFYVAQVLGVIIRQYGNQAAMVHFFDNKRYTPRGFPMTDRNMLHNRATYNQLNKEFLWHEVTNPSTSPPTTTSKRANIGPGFAE